MITLHVTIGNERFVLRTEAEVYAFCAARQTLQVLAA